MGIKFINVEKSMHKAEVVEVKKKRNSYGEYIQILFTVTEGNLRNYRFTGCCNFMPVKESRFYRWVKNILNEEPEENFDIEDLTKKECVISVAKRNDWYVVKEIYPIDDWDWMK